MKLSDRPHGRTLSNRHDAWIFRRSPRTAKIIQSARCKGAWVRAGIRVSAVNDNMHRVEVAGGPA